MKFLSFSSFGIAILSLFIVLLLINESVQADDCCPPPRRGAEAPRFQQNAQVTVYLDTTSGLTSEERQAIKSGLEDWNDEPNNSGVGPVFRNPGGGEFLVISMVGETISAPISVVTNWTADVKR